MLMEGALRICLAIDEYNKFASPTQKLIAGHILDMTAIGQINPCLPSPTSLRWSFRGLSTRSRVF
jgi:hypothetical protein